MIWLLLLSDSLVCTRICPWAHGVDFSNNFRSDSVPQVVVANNRCVIIALKVSPVCSLFVSYDDDRLSIWGFMMQFTLEITWPLSRRVNKRRSYPVYEENTDFYFCQGTCDRSKETDEFILLVDMNPYFPLPSISLYLPLTSWDNGPR